MEVLEHRGIGMVMRERAVRFGEQRNDISAQLLEGLDGDETRDPVAAVHHDFESAREWRVALDDRVLVRGKQSAVRGLRASGLR